MASTFMAWACQNRKLVGGILYTLVMLFLSLFLIITVVMSIANKIIHGVVQSLFQLFIHLMVIEQRESEGTLIKTVILD